MEANLFLVIKLQPVLITRAILQVASILRSKLKIEIEQKFYRNPTCCNGQNLSLNFYLSRIIRIESFWRSAYGHPIQDTAYLLHCPATNYLHRLLFGDSFSLYDLWSRLKRVAWLLGLLVFRHAPIFRKRSDDNNNYFPNFGLSLAILHYFIELKIITCSIGIYGKLKLQK